MIYGTIAGRLGRDAELRTTQSGQNVLNFSIAVDVGFGDRKHTLWIKAALWGKQAEALAPYLVKGKQVTVVGDLDVEEFEKRDGGTGHTVAVNVQRIDLQGGGGDAERPAGERAASPASTRSAPPPASTAKQAEFDDEIPF